MASNLPPGCSIRDIPGNRPEDQIEEALYDRIYEMLEKNGFEEEIAAMIGDAPPSRLEGLAVAIAKMVGDAYGEGYQQAQADEAQAKYWKECEQHEKEIK